MGIFTSKRPRNTHIRSGICPCCDMRQMIQEIAMQLTKGAIGNLINRYKAVLKKCHLLNTFGSLAVAGMLVMGSAGAAAAVTQGSITEDTVITTDTVVQPDQSSEDSTRKSGIIVESGSLTLSIADGNTLTVSNQGTTVTSGATRVYGASMQAGSSLSILGDVRFILEGDNDQEVRVLRLNGGSMDMKGNLLVQGTTTNSAINGVDVWTGGQLSVSGDSMSFDLSSDSGTVRGMFSDEKNASIRFSGGTLALDLSSNSGTIVGIKCAGPDSQVNIDTQNFNLTATTDSGRIVGIENFASQGSVININAETTTIDLNVRNNTNYTQAVLAYQSTTNFTGNTSIHIDSAANITYGVDVQCDPGNAYDTIVNFSGDRTVLDIEGTNTVYAVRASGVPGSINFTGNELVVSSVSRESSAAGLQSQYGAHLNVDAATEVTAKGQKSAYAVNLVEYANYAGNASFSGDLTASAEAEQGNAFAIYDSARASEASRDSDGKLKASGNVSLAARSAQGDAIGAYSLGEYAEISLGAEDRTVSVTANSQKEGGNAFGLLGEGGKIDVHGSAVDITAQSNGHACGIAASGDTQISLSGTTSVIADGTASSVAVAAAGTASISLGAFGDQVSLSAAGAEGVGIQADDAGTVNLYGDTTITAAKVFAGDGNIINNGDLTVSSGSFADFDGTFTQAAGTATLVTADFGGTVNVTGGTLNAATAAFNGTAEVSGGNLNVSDTLNLSQGSLTVSGGNASVAQGGSILFSGSNTDSLTISGGTFVADAGTMLATDFSALDDVAGAVNAASGNLNLRLDGGTYTAEQYNAARQALMEQGSEHATLNFLNASLATEEDQVLVVGGTENGGTVSIDMAPAVVDSDKAPEQGVEVSSVPTEIVSVVSNDAQKELLAADTIEVSNSSFTAQGLQIADTKEADAVTLAVKNGAQVTLTGGESGFTGIVNAEGDAVTTDVKIEDNAALTVGLVGNENAQNLVLNEVTVADGTFAVAGNGLDTTQVAASSLATEQNSTVAVDNASLSVGETVINDGQLNITNAVADLGTVTASGGVLFFDPSYGNIRNLQDGKLGSKLLVSDGSVVNVGSGLDDLQELAQKAGLSTIALGSDEFILAPGQSMLALGQNVTLDGGQIIVDAGVDASGNINGTPVNDAAYFGKNSLLVVNGSSINGAESAIDLKSGSLNVQNGAKLLIADAVAGQKYTVITGETNTDTAFNGGAYTDAGATGWKGSNLLTSSDMLTLTSDNGTVFTAKSEDAHTVFPNLSHELATAVNTLYGQKLNDVDADAMGVRFLSRATDNRFLGADKDAAAATIESAARIAFAGAVPQMAKMASDAGSNAVVNRLGFANPADGAQAMNAEGKIVDRNTTGFALWIAPLWQSQHGWGMEAGYLDYGFNGNLGGVSLGADYTFENAIRAGITFNIGGGYAESSGGDLNSTENRMSFWGLGAYAGWNYENFGLMADVSYTSTWNQLEQDLDPGMGMGDLEADVQATAISAGLRAEYKLETSVLDIIPHVGVRYMSLNTWGYDVDANGGTVMEGDGFHQDIWTFPVGVTFSKDFTLDNGWSFKPSIDFSVIPAAGDIKAKQDVAFTGLPGTYEVETQMMDYLTWQGGVGLEVGNDTMSFGVNYTLQAGQHTTGHGVFGSFRYEF